MVFDLNLKAVCECKCQRQTFSANLRYCVGTRRRWHKLFTKGTPACSCPLCDGKMCWGVIPLPKSCVNTANAVSLLSLLAISIAIMQWIPVSISGCHCSVCGTPNRQSISGNSIFKAPHCLNIRTNSDGLVSFKVDLSSCQTLSATSASTSPLSTIFCISCMVVSWTLKSNW